MDPAISPLSPPSLLARVDSGGLVKGPEGQLSLFQICVPVAAPAAAAASSGRAKVIIRTVPERLKRNQEFALLQQRSEKREALFLILEAHARTLGASAAAAAPVSKDPLSACTTPVDSGEAAAGDVIDQETIRTSLGTIRLASSQGKRKTMEDRSLGVEGSVRLRDKAHPFILMGVFDGHKGSEAADHVKANLQAVLVRHLEEESRTRENEEEAIFHALKKTSLTLDEGITGSAGTTMVFALILKERVWVANVGDSRAILLMRDKEIVQASEDALPHMPRYQRKIMALGGEIRHGCILGALSMNGLSVGRALGDHSIQAHSKENRSLQCCVPHGAKITAFPRAECGLILLCSDGLTHVASTAQIGEAAMEILEKKRSLEEIGRNLVFSALQAQQKLQDAHHQPLNAGPLLSRRERTLADLVEYRDNVSVAILHLGS